MLVVSALLLAAFGTADAEACPSREIFPTTDWQTKAAPSSSATAALEAFAFSLTGADEERKGIRTDAVLIVKGGVVVYERYARGFTRDTRHLTWSVTKSLTGVLAGVGVRRGLVDLSASICSYVDGLPQASCGITVEHLLTMGSGLDWQESYEEDESLLHSSVLIGLYGSGQRDLGVFNARHALRDPPGTSWRYSSGDSATLSRVLRKAMAPTLGERFLWPTLLQPIGAENGTVELDGAGTMVGGSYWYATARDAARLGYLALNDGCWRGERLLPAGWMAASTTPNSAYLKKRVGAGADDVYGRHWWLNRPVPDIGQKAPWPAAPEDLFAARGHWGQSILVIPSTDTIIVRFADDREAGAFDLNRFIPLAQAVADTGAAEELR